MGHINFDKESGKKRGLNGFYLALAICLVAVGGVAVATFLNSMPKINTENSNSTGITSSTTNKTDPSKPVGQIVTNVPDDRKTTTKAEYTNTTTTTPTTSGAADLFILPLTNDVIREYSDNKPVYSTTMNDWRVHNGVDFKGKSNQDVKALADGKIISISKDALWGNVIVIDHGFGIKSKYCGVSTSLKKDASVNVGDIIGKLSDIPCESSDGSHLHLEILVNDEYVNPIEAIGREVKSSAKIKAK